MKKTYLNLSFNSIEFHSIALKFRNLSGKIDALLSTGKFWEFSKNQQQRLLAKLRRLFEKLSGFDLKYALKIAGAAMCFALISGTANALPTFDDFVNPNNPFSFSTINGSSSFIVRDGAFADIDGDGDLDAILMTNSGPVFFKNEGGVFNEKTNIADNPFALLCGTNYYLPASALGTGIDMADFDGDGDLDAITINGLVSGQLVHFQMNSAGKFQYVSGSDLNVNHQYSFVGGYRAKFGDVDEDGDLDIVGTWSTGYMATLIQTSGEFESTVRHCFPYNSYIGPTSQVYINMADMDGDGDDDLFVFRNSPGSPGLAIPSSGPAIGYFQNTPGTGPFNLVTSGIPLPLADMSTEYFPLLADLDGDGDLDVFTPGDGGATNFRNLSANPVPISPLVALIAFAATGFGIFRKNRKKKTE
jgi:hypothetical protein